jgi:hypothetical protein
MKRLVSFLFWSFLFLVVCVGLDQLLVRVEMPLPVLAEVRTFYVDFRTRLLQLGHRLPANLGGAERKAPASVPAWPKAAPVQPKAAEPALSPPEKMSIPARPGSVPPAGASNPRYLYVDRQGELHFADRIEDVPVAFRKEAQRLEK